MSFNATNGNISSAPIYAAKGWRVIPIRPEGKIPLVNDWPGAATTDTRTIKRWWRKWPKANVGVACGPESGIFVLDVDLKNGKNGENSLKALERKHGKLPETREHRTPTGGRHLFFKCDNSVEVTNKASFAEGLDVRADRGLLAAA